jgi:hypothetical protein
MFTNEVFLQGSVLPNQVFRFPIDLTSPQRARQASQRRNTRPAREANLHDGRPETLTGTT